MVQSSSGWGVFRRDRNLLGIVLRYGFLTGVGRLTDCPLNGGLLPRISTAWWLPKDLRCGWSGASSLCLSRHRTLAEAPARARRVRCAHQLGGAARPRTVAVPHLLRRPHVRAPNRSIHWPLSTRRAHQRASPIAESRPDLPQQTTPAAVRPSPSYSAAEWLSVNGRCAAAIPMGMRASRPDCRAMRVRSVFERRCR